MHAVLHWQQFDLPWAKVHTPTPAKLHSLVAVVAHTLLAWTCNPLKIVYVEHSNNAPMHRYACCKDGRVHCPKPTHITRGVHSGQQQGIVHFNHTSSRTVCCRVQGTVDCVLLGSGHR